MTKDDILSLAGEWAPYLDRTRDGMYFALVQLYTIYHGEFPINFVARKTGGWYNIWGPVRKFAEKRGIDVDQNMAHARVDMEAKIASQGPVKRGRKPKVQKEPKRNVSGEMFDYYKKYKNRLPKDISRHKEKILGNMWDGLSAEQAFAPYMKK